MNKSDRDTRLAIGTNQKGVWAHFQPMGGTRTAKGFKARALNARINMRKGNDLKLHFRRACIREKVFFWYVFFLSCPFDLISLGFENPRFYFWSIRILATGDDDWILSPFWIQFFRFGVRSKRISKFSEKCLYEIRILFHQ